MRWTDAAQLCSQRSATSPDSEKTSRSSTPLKGHNQLWGRDDRDTSFLTLKRVHPNQKSNYIQNSASIFAVFCLIFNRLLKNLFWIMPMLFLSTQAGSVSYVVTEFSLNYAYRRLLGLGMSYNYDCDYSGTHNYF